MGIASAEVRNRNLNLFSNSIVGITVLLNPEAIRKPSENS